MVSNILDSFVASQIDVRPEPAPMAFSQALVGNRFLPIAQANGQEHVLLKPLASAMGWTIDFIGPKSTRVRAGDQLQILDLIVVDNAAYVPLSQALENRLKVAA